MTRFPPLKFNQDPVTYIAPTWNDMNDLAFEVSQQLREDNGQFDRIVTLAKGGWPMTRSLIDFTQIPEVASIGVKFYSGVNQRYDEPQIYQDIPVAIEGEKILLFDDVADSGESLIFTKQYLIDKGAAEVKTATLFSKPHSKIKPDYVAAETPAWIIFPFEPVEMVQLIGKKWLDQGFKKEEIAARFDQFKFPPATTQYALTLLNNN
ncbi:MAG: Purine phosphoribosyltransferase [Microgenomates bacterium 39_7]|nr:MAG: Purine phosphoribosyltransferase [Microgenomates bacterium 39_7]